MKFSKDLFVPLFLEAMVQMVLFSSFNNQQNSQDVVMLGADYYETDSEVASLLTEGRVPIGIGENTKIKYTFFFLSNFYQHNTKKITDEIISNGFFSYA